MSSHDKVVWSEGMFLRPQHFQQHDRYIQRLIHSRCHPTRPYGWGFTRLALDEASLALGKFGITSCAGVLPDGTPFDVDGDAAGALLMDVPEETRNVEVYLCLPLQRAGVLETEENSDPESLARFQPYDYDVGDSSAHNDETASIRVGKLRLRLALETDKLDEFTYLGAGRIVERQPDGAVVLDENFIPPCLDCRAIPLLAGYVREIRGLLQGRAESLSDRVTESGRGGVAEIANFLMLQMLNRYDPLFGHFSSMQGLHPETLYQAALQVVGELATFASKSRRPKVFEPYRHDDLQGTFEPLMQELRELFSRRQIEAATQIPIGPEDRYGFRVVVIDDNVRRLLARAEFVLAVRANVSAKVLQERFPAQTKIGPSERISKLVSAAIPGIELELLPSAPRQIKFDPGSSYFRLNRNSEYWSQLASSAGLALHVGGQFPDLELSLWAIQE